MKSRYLTPVAVAAVAVISATGAMAASNPMVSTQAKPGAAHVQQVSEQAAKPATHILYQSSTIAALPASGEVKLQGSVTGSEGVSFFTLKDATGSIKVEQPRTSRISLKDNAQITVFGRVEGAGDTLHITASRIVMASLAPPHQASPPHSTE